MSHSITRNANGNIDITLTRGDSLLLQIGLVKEINGVAEPYIPAEGCRVRFAMKRRYTDPDSEVLVDKQIPIDTLLLEIEPEDTKPLQMGKSYVYDIELTDENGRVDTFVKGNFTLENEVK